MLRLCISRFKWRCKWYFLYFGDTEIFELMHSLQIASLEDSNSSSNENNLSTKEVKQIKCTVEINIRSTLPASLFRFSVFPSVRSASRKSFGVLGLVCLAGLRAGVNSLGRLVHCAEEVFSFDESL